MDRLRIPSRSPSPELPIRQLLVSVGATLGISVRRKVALYSMVIKISNSDIYSLMIMGSRGLRKMNGRNISMTISRRKI